MDEAADTNTCQPEQIGLPTITILVVEDDDMVRKLITTVCASSGFTVLEAANGFEAIAACEAHPGKIHAMVTDVVMPGMRGRALGERLQALRPETRVIYCSGYTETSIVENATLDREVVFLQKPFTAQSLMQKIREVIGST